MVAKTHSKTTKTVSIVTNHFLTRSWPNILTGKPSHSCAFKTG